MRFNIFYLGLALGLNGPAFAEAPSVFEYRGPENEKFDDFLPEGTEILEKEPWVVVNNPFPAAVKNGAITWGDRLFIIPNPADCTRAEFMVWSHTYNDAGLLELKGQGVDGSFSLLLAEQARGLIVTPVPLTDVLYAPIDGREWPPFALGSFTFGEYDLARLLATEYDPYIFGFSLEFPKEVAGLKNNYWSLEGLFEAGREAAFLCEERNK